MQLGIVFPQLEIGDDPVVIRDFAQAAEAMGFHHILIYDHVLGADRDRPGGFRGPYDKDSTFHEPFVTLGYLAGLTKTIELATGVIILPQRQTALVAKQAAQVDVLSGGRLRLGVGTGWNDVEYEALGEDFHNRGKRQEEQVDLMRALWRDDAISFDGKWHKVTKAGIKPRPKRDIPIWFGGSAPALVQRIAKQGDGWIPIMGPNDAAREMIAAIHTAMTAHGRDPQSLGIQAQAQVAGGNPERWAKNASAWQALGATHLGLGTMGAGLPNVEAHLKAAEQWKAAITA
ncbi:MAG: LLM class F420-dependent oxidoreductase [Dehalococcoidia bacterium]